MPGGAESLRPVAVTGASGFIGRAVTRALRRRGWPVRALMRTSSAIPHPDPGVELITVGDLAQAPDLTHALEGAHAVVHLAGRAHVIDPDPVVSLTKFRAVNVDASAHLFRAAAAAGVTRFVHCSSVAVYGSSHPAEVTIEDGRPFAPDRPYGVSKAEAEQTLSDLALSTGVSVAHLRPPAVFGPEAPGHFRTLSRAAALGLPLPLAGVHNRRSFVYVDNLADAFACAVESRAEGGFIVTDSEPLSTAELYGMLARAVGRKALLWTLPPPLLKRVAALALGPQRGESLLGSMAVGGARFSEVFAWTPRVSFAQGLALTVDRGADA